MTGGILSADNSSTCAVAGACADTTIRYRISRTRIPSQTSVFANRFVGRGAASAANRDRHPRVIDCRHLRSRGCRSATLADLRLRLRPDFKIGRTGTTPKRSGAATGPRLCLSHHHQRIVLRSVTPCSVFGPLSVVLARCVTSRLVSKTVPSRRAGLSRQPIRMSRAPSSENPNPKFGVPVSR